MIRTGCPPTSPQFAFDRTPARVLVERRRSCNRLRGRGRFCVIVAHAVDHGEVAVDDTVKVFGAHLELEVLINAVIADLRQQIAGVAAAHRAIQRTIMGGHEPFDNCRVVSAFQ